MELAAFLEKYQIGIFVKAAPDGTEIVRGTDADAVTGLYCQLVGQQDYSVLKAYLDGQTLLPRMWGMGNVHCIMFPDPDGNVICMFLRFSGDVLALSQQCKLLMNRYLEEFEW